MASTLAESAGPDNREVFKEWDPSVTHVTCQKVQSVTHVTRRVTNRCDHVTASCAEFLYSCRVTRASRVCRVVGFLTVGFRGFLGVCVDGFTARLCEAHHLSARPTKACGGCLSTPRERWMTRQPGQE